MTVSQAWEGDHKAPREHLPELHCEATYLDPKEEGDGLPGRVVKSSGKPLFSARQVTMEMTGDSSTPHKPLNHFQTK